MIPSTNRNSATLILKQQKRGSEISAYKKQDYRQAAQSGSLLCLTARISAKFKD
jgi:hypothetical protein